MKRAKFASVAMTLVGLPILGLAGSDGGSELEAMRRAYEESLARLQATADAAWRSAQAQYARELDKVLAQFEKQGDVDGVMAVRREKQRVETEQTIPSVVSDEAPEPVRRLQADSLRVARDAEKAKSRNVLSLSESYISQLEGLKRDLTQAGRLDDALKVKREIDEVRDSLVVSCARVALETEKAPTNAASAVATGSKNTVWTVVRCGSCEGSGWSTTSCAMCGGSKKCPSCGGKGRKPMLNRNTAPCTLCKGRGRCSRCEGRGVEPCSVCKGKGTVMKAVEAQPTVGGAAPTAPADSSSASPAVATGKAGELTEYSRLGAELRKRFEDGRAEAASFEDVLSDPAAYIGHLLKSEVYLMDAYPRRVTVAGSADAARRGGFNLLPQSVATGEKAVKLVWNTKRSDPVVIVYGVLNRDNFTLYDIHPVADRQ